MSYTVWSVIAGEQPTAAKWNILGSNDESFNDGTGLGDSSVTSPKLAAGVIVQSVQTNYSSGATGTTTIPYDNTIPQITEGNEFMTITVTPKSATNTLVIEADILLGIGSNGQRIAALFQDSTANALAAKSAYVGNWPDAVPLVIRHSMTAGTTSAITFRIRCGSDVAGTWTFNGSGGGGTFGATTKSSIRVTEVKV